MIAAILKGKFRRSSVGQNGWRSDSNKTHEPDTSDLERLLARYLTGDHYSSLPIENIGGIRLPEKRGVEGQKRLACH